MNIYINCETGIEEIKDDGKHNNHVKKDDVININVNKLYWYTIENKKIREKNKEEKRSVAILIGVPLIHRKLINGYWVEMDELEKEQVGSWFKLNGHN
jgi:hypothetical protein